jgi:ABC-type polysaccharide/polyol phosphate export permease
MPQTAGQAMSIFVANLIVLLIVASFSLMSHIMIVLFPVMAPILALFTLALMLFMFVSLFLRMRRVSEWRYKKEKPVE